MNGYTIRQLAGTPEKDLPPTIRLATDANPEVAFLRALEILEQESDGLVNAVPLTGIKTPDSLEKLFTLYTNPLQGHTPPEPKLQTSHLSFSNLKSREIPLKCSETFGTFAATEYFGQKEHLPLLRDWLDKTSAMLSSIPETFNGKNVKIDWLNAMLPPRSNPVFDTDIKRHTHIDTIGDLERPNYRMVLSQRRSGMLVPNQKSATLVRNTYGWWNFYDYKPGNVELWQMPEGVPVIIRTGRDSIPPAPHLAHFLQSKTEKFNPGVLWRVDFYVA